MSPKALAGVLRGVLRVGQQGFRRLPGVGRGHEVEGRLEAERAAWAALGSTKEASCTPGGHLVHPSPTPGEPLKPLKNKQLLHSSASRIARAHRRPLTLPGGVHGVHGVTEGDGGLAAEAVRGVVGGGEPEADGTHREGADPEPQPEPGKVLPPGSADLARKSFWSGAEVDVVAEILAYRAAARAAWLDARPDPDPFVFPAAVTEALADGRWAKGPCLDAKADVDPFSGRGYRFPAVDPDSRFYDELVVNWVDLHRRQLARLERDELERLEREQTGEQTQEDER